MLLNQLKRKWRKQICETFLGPVVLLRNLNWLFERSQWRFRVAATQLLDRKLDNAAERALFVVLWHDTHLFQGPKPQWKPWFPALANRTLLDCLCLPIRIAWNTRLCFIDVVLSEIFRFLGRAYGSVLGDFAFEFPTCVDRLKFRAEFIAQSLVPEVCTGLLAGFDMGLDIGFHF